MNFFTTIAKGFFSWLLGFLDRLARDKSNRDLGAAQQREKDNAAVRDKQREWAEIDNRNESFDDASSGLFGNGDKQ